MSNNVNTAEDRIIARDRMRFIKNSGCATLCYLALLSNVFYFVLLYRQDVSNYYYTIQIGESVVYNLIFMLVVFLASEAVKNYNKNYSIALLIVGVMQVVRIFGIPTAAHGTSVTINEVETVVMSDMVYIRVVIYLLVSAAALIASAVINYMKCTALEAHVKSLESGHA